MTKQDRQEFIEKMEEMGDVWEDADVELVYGDRSLEEALADRRADICFMAGIFGKVLNS